MSEKSCFPSHWHWRVFAAPDIPDGLFEENKVIDDTLALPDGRVLHAQPIVFPEDGVLDMNSVLHPNPEILARTVLVADFTEEKDGVAYIGIGADWLLVFRMNGTILLDTRKTGNAITPIAPTNFVLEYQYHAGRNQIVYEVFGGEASFDVAAKHQSAPELVEMRYLPWASCPDAADGAVNITFSTTIPSPAGVRYRPLGSDEEWKVKYDSLFGRHCCNFSIHSIRLTDLLPDTEYEYQVVLRKKYRNYIPNVEPGTYQFHTAPVNARPFRFVYTADLQGADPTREAFLGNMFQSPLGKQADFFAFLGDVYWANHFEEDYVTLLLARLQRLTAPGKMLVIGHGNHELYGYDFEKFAQYFPAPPNGKDGYYMFRWGDTCFFVLDCCDDAPQQPSPSVRILHDFDPYIEEQARWLKKAVEQPMCTTAKFRIVLAHGLPVGDVHTPYMTNNIRRMIDPVFGGEHPKCQIHLWLGGHVHYAYRRNPNSRKWRCNFLLKERFPRFYSEEMQKAVYSFPIVVVSGPQPKGKPNMLYSSIGVAVEGDWITVTEQDFDGKEFDRFSISASGEFKEGPSAEWFTQYQMD